MAGELKVKFLPGLLCSSLSWCGHTLKFLSATQVLFKASGPEARSFPALLEVQGVAADGLGQAESHTPPGLEAPGSRWRSEAPEKSLSVLPGGRLSSRKPQLESKPPVQNPIKHDISSSLNY